MLDVKTWMERELKRTYAVLEGMVNQHGHAVMLIPSDGKYPQVAASLGLAKQKKPDIFLVGNFPDPGAYINHLVHLGFPWPVPERYAFGGLIQGTNGAMTTGLRVIERNSRVENYGILTRHFNKRHGLKPQGWVQLLMPDPSNRLVWDAAADEEWNEVQNFLLTDQSSGLPQ